MKSRQEKEHIIQEYKKLVAKCKQKFRKSSKINHVLLGVTGVFFGAALIASLASAPLAVFLTLALTSAFTGVASTGYLFIQTYFDREACEKYIQEFEEKYNIDVDEIENYIEECEKLNQMQEIFDLSQPSAQTQNTVLPSENKAPQKVQKKEQQETNHSSHEEENQGPTR